MGHSTNNIHTSRVNLDQGKIQYSTRNSISYLTPYAGLILTVTTIIVALARFYLLQNAILPRIYCPGTLEKMSSLQRRSFINHHVAASLKIVLIMTAIYPLFAILTGKALPSTPLSQGSNVTAGDMLIISTQIFTAIYIFELFFRDEISPISCAHHVGAITIGQVAVAMSFDAKHERDAVWEALLCFLWGK